ncbi:MAG: zinc ABC transporter substrate-binding protein [Rhodospirillaceae bacterium]|nr:zinc ABC transporter substrate-binding protein [Rhodospirillaceae bacterium]|tara:strand:+ start:2519 stop:3427 length:909 start_codon:yes stop_codon:yes gene_type:complete
MRKYLVWVVFCATLLPSQVSSKVNLFACEPEWSALGRVIGDKNIKAWSATSEVQDAHYIRARPSLIAKIRSAEIVFCSGAGLEVGWLPILMQRGARTEVQPTKVGNFMAFEYVNVLEIPAVIDRSLGDIHPEGNPHLHLDPRNLIILSKELARRLAIIDPKNGLVFNSNADTFSKTWHTNIKNWEFRATKLKNMPIIVHHKSWSYLINWLGLRQVASLEEKPGIPPSAGYLRKLVAKSKREAVKVIVRTPFDDDRPSKWLSNKTGIPAIVLPFTVKRGSGIKQLTTLFETILENLEKAYATR